MTEQWKPIKENPRYLISNLGRIKGRKGLIMHTSITGRTGNHYLGITIHTENNEEVRRKIHRLVAIAFIPNPNNYREVNHIDGDRYNNFASNLEWCSRIQNMAHASKMGLIIRGENHQSAKLTEGQVKEIRELAKTKTQTEICKKYKMSSGQISRIVNRKLWIHIA